MFTTVIGVVLVHALDETNVNPFSSVLPPLRPVDYYYAVDVQSSIFVT